MTASGTFGYGKEFEDFVDLEKIGGIIVKGTTLHHREGCVLAYCVCLCFLFSHHSVEDLFISF